MLDKLRRYCSSASCSPVTTRKEREGRGAWKGGVRKKQQKRRWQEVGAYDNKRRGSSTNRKATRDLGGEEQTTGEETNRNQKLCKHKASTVLADEEASLCPHRVTAGLKEGHKQKLLPTELYQEVLSMVTNEDLEYLRFLSARERTLNVRFCLLFLQSPPPVKSFRTIQCFIENGCRTQCAC